jgi:hypothetical protein
MSGTFRIPPKSVTAPRFPVLRVAALSARAAECVGAVRDADQPPRWLSGALIPVAAHHPVRGLDRALARPDAGFLRPSSPGAAGWRPGRPRGSEEDRFVVYVSGVGYRLLE